MKKYFGESATIVPIDGKNYAKTLGFYIFFFIVQKVLIKVEKSPFEIKILKNYTRFWTGNINLHEIDV
jgi:hypothetical protein